MARIPFLLCFLAALNLVSADGIYNGKSPVLQVTANTYDSLIAQSNHTSIVEFYAPWCGHCQNLKPAYEKAAKNLAGLAKVAAINCDDEANKALCAQFGVQGFPTLKIVKPGKKSGRPIVEDYQGPRTAKGIVDAVVDKIPNHVKKLQDSGLDSWLEDKTTEAKAILFTEKGTIAPLIKALSVDFLGSISFAQVRSKEKAAVENYGITRFPTIILLPGGDKEPLTYDGEMKKEALLQFFSQVAEPNLDPAPKKAKASSSKKPKSAASSSSTASSAFSKASEAHKSADFDAYMEHASTIILDESIPTESPTPNVEYEEKPMVVPDAVPAIPLLSSAADLQSACLTPKSGNCIFVLLPANENSLLPENALQALAGFAEVYEKHRKRRANIFPFYGVPAANEAAETIRQMLGLNPATKLEVIALNMKRGWWRHYTAANYNLESIGAFVDAIKLGEGNKQKLPEEFYSGKTDDSVPKPEQVVEPQTTEESEHSEAEPVPAATASLHDEL